MQIIDPELQRAVWSRVRGSALPASPPALPDLLSIAQDELNDGALYQRLGRRLWGRDAALLRRMAAEERAHARALLAAAFLKTGTRVRLAPAAPARSLPLPEALRAACAREDRAIETCESAARRLPGQAELFHSMAGDERRHRLWLQELLGKSLCG